LIEEYERALDECNDNHDDIDYEIAQAQQQLEDAIDKAGAKQQIARLRLIERVKIYRLYAAIWVTPALIGLVMWWTLSPGTPAR
jgi:hypothetical protein